jgi:hypothetical protein
VIRPFWDAVMRANARLVLLWVCLACCLVAAAWMLVLEFPSEDDLVAAPPYRPPLPASPESPETVLPGEGEAVPEPSPLDNDPFASLSLARELERIQAQRDAEAQAEQVQTQEPEPAPAPDPEPAPPPAPPPERFLYRGMFARPDGTVLGLVENQTAQSRRFVRRGETVAGRAVDAITRHALTLLPHGDESAFTLTNGVPREVPIPQP